MVSKFESFEIVLFQAMIRFSAQNSNLILVANDQGIEGHSGNLLGTAGRLFLFERRTSD